MHAPGGVEAVGALEAYFGGRAVEEAGADCVEDGAVVDGAAHGDSVHVCGGDDDDAVFDLAVDLLLQPTVNHVIRNPPRVVNAALNHRTVYANFLHDLSRAAPVRSFGEVTWLVWFRRIVAFFEELFKVLPVL